jgi:diguanylate cyclase (GGDEF)-like protein
MPGTAVLVLDGHLRMVAATGEALRDIGDPAEITPGTRLNEALAEHLAIMEHHAEIALGGDESSFEVTTSGGLELTGHAAPLLVEVPGRGPEILAVVVSLQPQTAGDGRDRLTGLLNQQAFQSQLTAAIPIAKRHGLIAALLLINLDRFADVSDTIGRAGGDKVLRQVADRMRTRLRESDVVARLEGDEFAVLLRGADREQGRLVGEQLLTQIHTTPISQPGGPSVLLTASASVTAVRPSPGLTAAGLMERAHSALRAAKDSGRNRVYAAER